MGMVQGQMLRGSKAPPPLGFPIKLMQGSLHEMSDVCIRVMMKGFIHL